LGRFEVVQTTPDLIASALGLHVLNGLSFYDALFVRAAQAGGCACAPSEDMQAGARLGGVQIVNPFTA
jgi:predicted nucleic acid-binding protein